jgi:protein O-GlcNAc transferase
MGLFSRFRAPAGGGRGEAETPGQDAPALIEQGNALEDEGLLERALECYQEAVRLAPNLARAHLNHGNVLLAMGDAEAAVAAYATALSHDPDYAAAHYNIGKANFTSGRPQAALAAFDRAIELKPDFVDAEVGRSLLLADLGRLDEAVAGYLRVLAIKPDYAEMHYCMGNALNGLGRVAEAAQCYRRAAGLKPDYLEAHGSLGSALQDLGQLDEAAASYRTALELKPDYAEVHGNLGNVLRNLGQLEQAAASYGRVLAIQPESAEACSNLGVALSELGRFDEAMASFHRALELNRDLPGLHNNIGNTLKDLGQLDRAETSYLQGLKIKPDDSELHSNLLFLQNYRANLSAPLLLAQAVRYGDMATRRARPYAAWSNTREPDRRLRVGLLSGDFRAHPVGYFLDSMLEVLASAAPDQLELHAYPSYFCNDAVARRIKAHCHRWQSALGLSDESLARRIHDDGIDILIDLSGHTAHNRLPVFAWKPAPVQATWLGYLATTGLKAIDYLIADAWTLPKTEEANFTEEIWRLPQSYLCFTPPTDGIDVGPLPALGNGHVTFGSFNNLTKMNDAVVALWARVLASVPNSRLLLKSRQLTDASVRQRVLDDYARHGVDGARLILEGLVPRSEYLKPFRRIDIALDPFPYTGITTSVESLWMGVPVLTLAGKSFLSRQGVGLMMNADLPEWIAHDADDYVARAASHAADLRALASLRGGLRERALASPIFDAPRFAHHFQAALRGMWRKWCGAEVH